MHSGRISTAKSVKMDIHEGESRGKQGDLVSESWTFTPSMGVSSFQDETATFEHYYSPSRAKSLYSKHKELAFDHDKRIRKIAWERKQTCAELQKEHLMFKQKKDRLQNTRTRHKSQLTPATPISEAYALQGRFSSVGLTYSGLVDVNECEEKAETLAQSKLLRLRKKLRAASAPSRVSADFVDTRIWSPDGATSVPRDRPQRSTPVMLQHVLSEREALNNKMDVFIGQIEKFKEDYRKSIERKLVKKRVVDDDELRNDGQQLKLNRKMAIRNPYAIFNRVNLLKSKAETVDQREEDSRGQHGIIQEQEEPDNANQSVPERNLPNQADGTQNFDSDTPGNPKGIKLETNPIENNNIQISNMTDTTDRGTPVCMDKPRRLEQKPVRVKRKASSTKKPRTSTGSSAGSLPGSRRPSVQINLKLGSVVEGNGHVITCAGMEGSVSERVDGPRNRRTASFRELLRAKKAEEEAKPSHLMLAWNELLEDMHDVERFRKVAAVVTESKANHRRVRTARN